MNHLDHRQAHEILMQQHALNQRLGIQPAGYHPVAPLGHHDMVSTVHPTVTAIPEHAFPNLALDRPVTIRQTTSIERKFEIEPHASTPNANSGGSDAGAAILVGLFLLGLAAL